MRALLAELRKPRYAALSGLMIAIAAVCCVAGTWQIARYDDKHLANDELRANAHAAVATIGTVLPTTSPGEPSGASPNKDGVEFRTVTATGEYAPGSQVLLRRAQLDDANGYEVVTPLQTAAATVLVMRGFIASDDPHFRPDAVSPPPTGTVTIRGRVQTSSAADDHFGVISAGQVDTVNATAAAERLGRAVYDGYVELDTDQPGTQGLTPLPAPDLSNPAGGAFELQHLAYIVQWYLFAVLALIAPLAMIRADRKRAVEDTAWRADFAQRRLESAPTVGALEQPETSGTAVVRTNQERTDLERTAERLADRYGR